MRVAWSCVLLLLLTASVDARTGHARASRGKAMTVSATAYCQRGETSSGDRAHRGVVAADPRVMPTGSRVRVLAPKAYRGTYTVADRGPAVKGREIDMFMPNCREAERFGRKRLRVQMLRSGSD
jgi:3D (Asp-Asp-Asp) domain-containing protein